MKTFGHSARTLTVLLIGALACGCDRSPAAPSSRTADPGPSAPPGFAVTPFHISGVVTDEGGQPLANAEVLVNHYDHLRDDGTPAYPVRSTRSRTDSSGHYEMDIQAVRGYPSGLTGLTDVIGDGFARGARRWEIDSQFFTSSTSTVVRNFQIDRIVDLALGDSATVTFRPDASLCVEYILSSGPLCRVVSIAVPGDGMLTLSAVPLTAGATEVYIGLLNLLDGSEPPAPGFTGFTTVSYPVKAGTIQEALLQIARGFVTPRSYVVTAVLR